MKKEITGLLMMNGRISPEDFKQLETLVADHGGDDDGGLMAGFLGFNNLRDGTMPAALRSLLVQSDIDFIWEYGYVRDPVAHLQTWSEEHHGMITCPLWNEQVHISVEDMRSPQRQDAARHMSELYQHLSERHGLLIEQPTKEDSEVTSPADMTHVKNLTFVGTEDVTIDASVYGPVPEVEIALSVWEDANNQRWARMDEAFHKLVGRNCLRLPG